MNEQLQEDWLDARLRDEAPYLDDAGFTAAVMKQVPTQRKHARSSRSVILVGITLIACALAYLLTGRGGFIADSAAFLVAMPLWTICFVAVCSGVLITALGATAAVAKLRE